MARASLLVRRHKKGADMDIELGASVRTSDGADVGNVKRAIYDTRRDRVTAFLLDTGGLLGKSVIVPIERLGHTPDGAIRVQMRQDEFDALEPYVPDDYVAPPYGWIPPIAAYPYAPIGYLWPAVLADQPPLAQGERRRATPAKEPLAKGMPVKDRDGDDIGVLEDLRTTSEGMPVSLTVRLGSTLRTTLGGGDEVVLDADELAGVAEGAVHLRRHKERVVREGERDRS